MAASEAKSMVSPDDEARVRIAAQFRKEKFREAYDHTLPITMQRYMPLDKAVNILLRATQQTRGLLKCDLRSLQQSVLDGAALGLEVAGPLQQSHLVPFWNKHRNVHESKLIIGYRGFLELMQRTDRLDGAPIVQWVYKNDTHKLDVADPKRPLIHTPCIEGDRGSLLFVYILVFFKKSDRPFFDFRTKAQIEQHRDRFAKKDKHGNWSDLWRIHFESAGIKTMIRLSSKHLPQSNELALAVQYDQAEEMGQRVTIAREWDGAMEDETLPAPAAPQGSEADKLAQELGGVPLEEQGEFIDAEFREEGPPPSNPDPLKGAAHLEYQAGAAEPTGSQTQEPQETPEAPSPSPAPPLAEAPQAAPSAPEPPKPPKPGRGTMPKSLVDFLDCQNYALDNGIDQPHFDAMCAELDLNSEDARTLHAGRRKILRERLEIAVQVIQEATDGAEEEAKRAAMPPIEDRTLRASDEEVQAIFESGKALGMYQTEPEMLAVARILLRKDSLMEAQDLTRQDIKGLAEHIETRTL